MLIPYSWIKKFVKVERPPEEVAQDLSFSVIGVEGIKERAGEKILDLDVTYNRGDLLSVVGIARELAALYGKDFEGEEEQFSPPKEIEKLNIKVDEKLSPTYSLTQISNLSYKSTPKEIRRRIEAAGARSVNLWADLTNYIMFEWGQPFHAFDADKVRQRDPSLSIQVRRAKRGETIKTLDGLNRKLEREDIVIADKRGPIAVAGVMGGKDTEVNEETSEILLEAAIFNPIAIRKTARRLGLRSEASNRFEHYLSPENLLISLSKVVQMYKDYGKGKVTAYSLVGNMKTEHEPVVLSQAKLDSVSGERILIKEARGHLKNLGFKVMSSEKGLLCWPPHFRGDINIPEDLVEEVLRLHGYEDLPATPLQTTLSESTRVEMEVWRDEISRLLAYNGFFEVKTYPFLSTKTLIHTNRKNLIQLENPISAEAQYMRPSLLLSLVEAGERNAPRFPKGKIFELEKVYPKGSEEYFSLGALIWGEEEPFLAIKGVLESVLRKANISASFAPLKGSNYWHPSKSAQIKVGRETLGEMGELHPHLATTFNLEGAALWEVNFEKLVNLASQWGDFSPIPSHPQVYEDFSFTLKEEHPIVDILEKIKNATDIIREVSIIDRFVKEGKRSFTLRVTFQSPKRSLSSEDIEPLRKKIQEIIKKGKGNIRD